jgi:hypothetical protein
MILFIPGNCYHEHQKPKPHLKPFNTKKTRTYSVGNPILVWDRHKIVKWLTWLMKHLLLILGSPTTDRYKQSIKKTLQFNIQSKRTHTIIRSYNNRNLCMFQLVYIICTQFSYLYFSNPTTTSESQRCLKTTI